MESMTRVFLSVPMKGRTKENIEKSLDKMKALAKLILNDPDVMFINTFVEDKPPYMNSNAAVWYLGKSLELLSTADVLVTVDTPYWMQSHGVETEQKVFRDYVLNNCHDTEEIKYIELPLNWIVSSDEFKELVKKFKPDGAACRVSDRSCEN